jgi:ABC-type phosphate/phosphonate transport system substrate-binding protein
MLCALRSAHFVWQAAVPITFLSMFTLSAGSREKDDPSTLRIGLSSRILQEVAEDKRKEATESLEKMVQTHTGHPNRVTVESDIEKLAKDLSENKLDFGVFLGFEFAWARQKNPKLLPLVIGLTGADPHLRAHVIVRQNNPAVSLTQLQGKPFGFPAESRAHCRLFLERQCKAQGKSPQAFFAQLTSPATMEDALDDVVDGVVQGTIMDDTSLEAYKRRKPGRFVKLKEIQTSEVFPSPVIAYQPGNLDEATLKRFRDDLIRANQDADAQRLLTLWKVVGFGQIPDDYEKTLAAIAKAYPTETDATKSK